MVFIIGLSYFRSQKTVEEKYTGLYISCQKEMSYIQEYTTVKVKLFPLKGNVLILQESTNFSERNVLKVQEQIE